MRKATVGVVMSVRPHGTTRLPIRTDFREIRYLGVFTKSVEKVEFKIEVVDKKCVEQPFSSSKILPVMRLCGPVAQSV
jgi:hypothetical protein